MTTAINFDSVPQVRKAAANAPSAGTAWFSHDGDKYPCLYLGVGKRGATWYFKGRLNGKSQQKSLKATFPQTTAAQAKQKIEALAKHYSNEANADIRTVRDAWLHHCKSSKSDGRMSGKNEIDMTSKLERWASDILDCAPTDVSTVMVQNAINAIDTGRGNNSAATKRHVRAALSAAFRRLGGENPVRNVTVPKANESNALWYDLCDTNRDLDPEDLSTVWQAIMAKREQNVIMGTAWIVMLFTGIRTSNICSLRWERDDEHGWVDLQRKTITFPKLKSGAKNREIPICDTVANALLAIRAGGSEWVFPASSKTGYLGGGDGLDRLRAEIDGKMVDVIKPHDTRRFFQEAANEALLPEHVMWFLRGDTKGDGSMLAKYTKRVGKSAPAMLESVMFERIKVEPSFAH
ncbi:integrase family protein [Ruegeria atlantica]|uniref:integrase family protein n=1 Tax=Ruegeria atlantica TaxID=81569 RepID=UPI001480D4DB|nr:integrase family protein [Ruegeria atlantica]